MSFPRYESYNPSGIPWIAALPSHWQSRRLKTLFRRMQRSVSSADGIVTAFRDGQVTLRANRREDGFTNALQEVGYQGVRKGDLVISAMDAFAGAIGVSESDGKSTPVYSVCRPNDGVDVRYYALLLRHMALSGFVNALAKGIRERSTEFRWADASPLTLPCPPLDEQERIVRYLDGETKKIDALVEAQRQLIELLKEKRQAVISHAVTKGLDLTSPMRESGVDWLGNVPTHWNTIPIRALFRFVKRQNGDELDVLSVYRDHGVISKSSRDDNRNVTPEDLSKYQTVYPGDLVINKMKAWQGSLGISELTGITSPDYAVFEPIHSGSSSYLHLLLRSQLLPDVYRLISNGIRLSQWRLEPDKFKGLKVPWPPISEQKTISDKLMGTAVPMAKLALRAEAAIGLLQERRSALISAAVTGKIDVRGFVPEQAEAA